MVRSLAKLLTATAMSLCVITSPAAARAPLSSVSSVTESLITAGMAYEIARVCGPIELRMLRGVLFMNGIVADAQRRGYTRAEIDAYTNDDVQKDRLKAIARERLAQKGARSGVAESYCTLGRAEIAAGSELGRLLKS